MSMQGKVLSAVVLVMLVAAAALWWWLATADTRAAQKQREARLGVCVSIIQTGDPQFNDKLDDCLARFGP